MASKKGSVSTNNVSSWLSDHRTAIFTSIGVIVVAVIAFPLLSLLGAAVGLGQGVLGLGIDIAKWFDNNLPWLLPLVTGLGLFIGTIAAVRFLNKKNLENPIDKAAALELAKGIQKKGTVADLNDQEIKDAIDAADAAARNSPEAKNDSEYEKEREGTSDEDAMNEFAGREI